jgi:hypothetical protein
MVAMLPEGIDENKNLFFGSPVCLESIFSSKTNWVGRIRLPGNRFFMELFASPDNTANLN